MGRAARAFVVLILTAGFAFAGVTLLLRRLSSQRPLKQTEPVKHDTEPATKPAIPFYEIETTPPSFEQPGGSGELESPALAPEGSSGAVEPDSEPVALPPIIPPVRLHDTFTAASSDGSPSERHGPFAAVRHGHSERQDRAVPKRSAFRTSDFRRPVETHEGRFQRGLQAFRPWHMAVVIAAFAALFYGGTTFTGASHGTPIIDLTHAGASVTHNGAVFLQAGSGAGTGNWDPFLTFNVPGSDPNEKGYNSDGPAQFDEFYGGSRTHPLSLAAIPTVEIGGVVYREFGLDSNDSGNDDYMSVDEFKLFVDNQSNLDTYSEATELFGNDDDAVKGKVFDMDDNCDGNPGGCTVFMRSQALSAGSGVSDIIIRVPNSVFAAFPNCYYGSSTCGQYVYLWSAMGYTVGDPLNDGITQNWNTNAGFEEWQTRLAPVVEVHKTAETSYSQDYTWTVEKKVKVDGTCVDDAEVDLFTGESQDAEWCIDVTRALGNQANQTVSGEITIYNPTGPTNKGGSGVIPTAIDATITSISDVISSVDFADLNVTPSCGVTFPYKLAAGKTLVCTYTKATPAADGDTTGTNTATVVVQNAGTSFIGTADFDFGGSGPAAETNASATLTDDEGPLDQDFNGSDSTSYINTYSCDGDEGLTSNTAVITPSDGGPADQDTATLDITCWRISVTKDASTSLTRTYQWTIDKSVDPDTWDLFTGESGTSEYTVVVNTTGTSDSAAAVTGNIHVSNPSGAPSATINSVADVISGYGDADSVNCGVTFPYTLAAGATLDCTYSSDLPDTTTRTNNATATQQLHTYDEDGVQSDDGTSDEDGTASVDFSSATVTEVYPTVDITDTYEGDLGSCDSAGTLPCQFTYKRTFACDGDEGTKDNTAEITQTGQTDDASVTVNCYDLEVTKDATPSFDRTYEWDIDKTSDCSTLTLDVGETSSACSYDVTVSVTGYSDDNFGVSGSIYIDNNHPTRDADLTGVVDEITGPIAGIVSCPSLTVPAGGQLVCTYSADLPDDSGRTNTATATQQLYDFDKDLVATSDGTTDYSGNASISFSSSPTEEFDDCVDVTDTNVGDLGTVCQDEAPYTFSYDIYFGPFTSDQCGEHQFDNTAEFTTNDSSTTGQAVWTVIVNVVCPQLNFETAYALGLDATCFTDLGLDIKNWGWVNGDGSATIVPGEYDWDVWAGAAQCDTSKGVLVGTVHVNYTGSDVIVTFDLNPGVELGDVHVYAGEELPDSFAPGQWDVNVSGGPVYIIIHAVVGVPE